MNPIHHKFTDAVVGAPKDWNENEKGPCGGLPVRMADGNFYSYWKPSLAEKIKIIFGHPVRLCIVSTRHPPVNVSVEKN